MAELHPGSSTASSSRQQQAAAGSSKQQQAAAQAAAAAMHATSKGSTLPLWPQLQTRELLADLQWIAAEEGDPGGPLKGPNSDTVLPQQQQQQLRLTQILEAANEDKQSAAVAAAAALFQCERQRQRLLQEVLACCLQCELLRLAFLSACASTASKQQQDQQSEQQQGGQQQQQQLEAALQQSICVGVAASCSPALLPSAAQSLETYWERLRGLPVVFGGEQRCALEAVEVRQIEKDFKRETVALNGQVLRGAEGLPRLLRALCSQIWEAEAAAAPAPAPAPAAEEAAAAAAAEGPSWPPPKTVEALLSLGLLRADLCSSTAAAAPPGVWAAAARVLCAIRILAVSSRTHGGGAAFAAAARAFACPAVPSLLQPDNQVAAGSEQQQEEQQQQQQQQQGRLCSGSPNVTEIIASCCCSSQRAETAGPLAAFVHTVTPFKLLLPDHDSHDPAQQQQHQQQQQQVLQGLGSVCVDAHFFASLRSVSLERPSAELLQFDQFVRRREAAAALLAAALEVELRGTKRKEGERERLVWLPVEASQEWVFVRCRTGQEENC
ncbi:hypothetical protein Efla_001632 [Eimeria flavescens]